MFSSFGCWRRLLRVPCTARRSNQSILKEISPGCSLEGLMLKLKLQYFGHLMWRAKSLEKTLMLGKIEGERGREWPRMRWLVGITNSTDMSLSKLRELQFMGWKSDTTEQLNNNKYTSTRFKPHELPAFNPLWEELRVEIRNEASHALGTWQDRSSDRHFQGLILWS